MEKLIKSLICLIPVILFWFIPVPEGLQASTWHILGLYLGTVLGVILRPYPEPVILISSMAILSVGYLDLKSALAEFSSSTSWLILTAFIIGHCFVITGLGKRIAYLLIDKFGHTTLRLGYVSTLTDFILSPAIPSNTARSGGLTGGITKISTAAVAIGFLALATLTKVIEWKQVMDVKSGWSTFVWYSGIMSISGVLTKGGFFTWLGEYLKHHLALQGVEPLIALAILLLLTMVVRYFFASTIAYVVTFVPVIFTIGHVANLPAIPLLLLVAASAQIASLLTHYGNAVGPLLFGAGYVSQKRWWMTGHIIAYYSMVIYFVVGLAWWKLIGLW